MLNFGHLAAVGAFVGVSTMIAQLPQLRADER
jgi:hypothetical protein